MLGYQGVPKPGKAQSESIETKPLVAYSVKKKIKGKKKTAGSKRLIYCLACAVGTVTHF
jgi:hypothetical protein